MQPISIAILSRIHGHGRGWVFTNRDFVDIADPRTIGVVLGRLISKGTIRRLNQGLYYYPKIHSDIGELLPFVDEIGKAMAKRDKIRLLPSGAYAANRLGLSEQVPAKVVFLSDTAKTKKIAVGKTTIEFRKTTPRHMALAGKESGLVIQALRHLGRQHVDEKVVRKLRGLLSTTTKKELVKNLALAPAWMRLVLKEIAGERRE